MIRTGILRLCGVLALSGLLLVACSSSTTTSSPPAGGTTSATTETSSPPASSPASNGGGSTNDLAGQWKGSWKDSANDTGSFSVDFTQSGSALKGTLTIPIQCLDGAKVTGQVNGNTIEFGSVQGQCQVNYKGSVNGDQMSGTYDISQGQGGTWKASKA